jgi:hypothetical protein
MVITLTQGLTLTILQDRLKASAARLVVSTKVFDFDIANLQRSSCLSMDSTALPGNPPPPLPHAKAPEARSIVCTNVAGIVLTTIQKSATAQLSGKFVEQKNTLLGGLNSRNFSLRLVATKKT